MRRNFDRSQRITDFSVSLEGYRHLGGRFVQLLVLLLVFLSLIVPGTAHSLSCCERPFYTEITTPDGINPNNVETAWENILTDSLLTDCPLKFFPSGSWGPKFDYKFQGKLARSGGDFNERWDLQVDLIDFHRGSVIDSKEASWWCKSSQFDYCINDLLMAQVKTLANRFKLGPPIDFIIHKYEQIPESVNVDIEKDPVYSKDRISIDVKRIIGPQGFYSQPWQRILAKVEEGQILNGKPKGVYRVFEVGDGSVEINYEAPDICEEKKETITISNSCTIDPKEVAVEDKEIATKKFDIKPKVKGELKFVTKLLFKTPNGYNTVHYTGKAGFSVDHNQDPPKISGKGHLSYAHIEGMFEECVIEVQPSSISVKLGGILAEQPQGESQLKFKIERNYTTTLSGTAVCPTPKGPVTLPILVMPKGAVKSRLKFPVENGAKKEWAQLYGGEGQHEVELHIECPKGK